MGEGQTPKVWEWDIKVGMMGDGGHSGIAPIAFGAPSNFLSPRYGNKMTKRPEAIYIYIY